jgi:hypothetical protein
MEHEIQDKTTTTKIKRRSALLQMGAYVILRFMTIPLFSLYYKIRAFIYKRNYSMVLLTNELLDLIIRLSIPAAMQEGHNKTLDRMIHVATLKLLHPDYFRKRIPSYIGKDIFASGVRDAMIEHIEFYKENKEEIDQIIKNISRDEEVKNTILIRFMLEHYFKKNISADEFANRMLKKAKSIDPNISEYKRKDVIKVRKKLIKKVSDLRFDLSEREAIKISLSFEKSGLIIGVLSTFFLLSGIIYNSLFYKELGFEAQKYFVLSDYVSSSVEQARASAVGALIGVIALFIGIHSRSRESAASIEIYREKDRRLRYFLVIVVIIPNLFLFLSGGYKSYLAVSSLIFFIGLIFSPYVARKYFKDPLTALFILIFLTGYSGQMYLAIYGEAWTIRNWEVNKTDCPVYDFAVDAFEERKPCELLVIGASGGHFFVMDYVDKRIVAVPRNSLRMASHSIATDSFGVLVEEFIEWVNSLKGDSAS